MVRCCRNMSDASRMPGLHSPPLWLFHLGSAPSTHHAKVIKAHRHQHDFTSSFHSPRASPAWSCCAPTSACAFSFPDSSSIWNLPAAAATVSRSSCHPDLSAGCGECITSTESASSQLWANMGRSAIYYSFSLFFPPLLCFFCEKHQPFPPWFTTNFAKWVCLIPKTLQEQGGGAGLHFSAVLAACVHVSVRVQRQGRVQPGSCLMPDRCQLCSHLSLTAPWLNTRFSWAKSL